MPEHLIKAINYLLDSSGLSFKLLDIPNKYTIEYMSYGEKYRVILSQDGVVNVTRFKSCGLIRLTSAAEGDHNCISIKDELIKNFNRTS